MNKPRHIEPGDTVGIVAPSSPITKEQVETGLRMLEERGYKVVLGEHLWEREGYLAGPDEHRAEDVQRMFADPTVKAIICARGGFGATRMMDYLDLEVIAENPKVLMGFSDVTFLHLAAQAEADLVSFYGPMLITFSVERPPWVAEQWFRAMETPAPLPPLPVEGKATTIVGGKAEGIVLGGCLSLVASSIGTPWEIDPTESLLILEDVDVPQHRVDGTFQQLKQCGLLAAVEGFVVGEMTRSNEKSEASIGDKPVEEIVAGHLQGRGVPAVVGLPLGHVPTPLTLPMGITARLDADKGTLTYLESATT